MSYDRRQDIPTVAREDGDVKEGGDCSKDEDCKDSLVCSEERCSTKVDAAEEAVKDVLRDCFPADASVELEDGQVKPMAQLEIGDSVRVGATSFAKVFMFTHREGEAVSNYLTINTDTGTSIKVTPGHYIYANGKLVPAQMVKAGDLLVRGDGATGTVTKVTNGVAKGLYNPQTTHGDIVVNDILASTYTTAVERVCAHAMLSPLRLVFNVLGLGTRSFESGAKGIVDFMPIGY